MNYSSIHNYQDRIWGKERWLNTGRLVPLFFFSLAISTIFTCFLYFPNPFKPMPENDSIKTHRGPTMKCDLFKGRWIADPKGSRYTNSSCATIPDSKNCFRHGREDRNFLDWRWKPDDCDLSKFDPKTFFDIVRGKKMAFIGDSVARNHMESLLCLLSQNEVAKDVYRDSEDRHRVWHFPKHDFTLMTLWSKFLVLGKERMINGSSSGGFNLHLDKIDDNWVTNLPTIDYAIISDAHWFFRPIYLHEGSNLVGCVYCGDPNVTDIGVNGAIRMAFRASMEYITNNCKECKKSLLTLVRTFSPAHFENGTWNTGGSCSRTSPFSEGEVNWGGSEWELRKIQLEEIERARKEGEKKGMKFGVLDITRTMLMRPDGHPGSHWGNKWMKGYNDCVHWCMPGPIDVWNDFLMAVIAKHYGQR